MTASPPPPASEDRHAPAGASAPRRRRDAVGTRQLLLDAARRHFANHGYAATTVRQIADDAGVNVALINRYFESKEGLFTACLTESVGELRRTAAHDGPLDTLPDVIASQVIGSGAEESSREHLLLLLCSSGDERADDIRLSVLRAYGERVAAKAGWRADDPDSGQLLLRAQVIVSTAMGILLLRSSGLQPLAAADERTLATPLRDLITVMLPPR